MSILYGDFETFGSVDLRVCGADVYARHHETGVHCFGFAFDSEPSDLINFHTDTIPLDHRILRHVANGGEFVAHNAPFELHIWNDICVPQMGWPELKPEQVRCTMAQSYAMAIPGSLDGSARALGVEHQKDLKGSRMMLKLARPKDDGIFWKYQDDPSKFEILFNYCRQDVEVERDLDRRQMRLSARERDMWLLDYKINQRGIQIDLESVEKAIRLVEKEHQRLNASMLRLTGGVVAKTTEVQLLVQWIRQQGVAIDGLSKRNVLDALEGNLPPSVQQALALRKEGAKTSTAKLTAMRERAGDDGRVRSTMQFHGASTGRWSGRGIQPQNLSRPRIGIKQSDIEDMFVHLDDINYIDLMHGPVMDAMADCVRGMITAAPGHELIAMDFSAIEARVLAWLAGEEAVLDIFKTHGKIYEHAAAGIFNKPIEEITKDERQIGKVAVLALGYQGGVGAFQSMANIYGVQVEDTRADRIKKAWRNSHRNIVSFWYDLEHAAINAVVYEGKVFTAGAHGREIRFKKDGSILICQLPSKRKICYPFATVRDTETKWGELRPTLFYYTSFGSNWTKISGYGGLLCENVTQGAAACLLRGALMRLEEAGYPVVFHAHDEAVVEIPETAPPSAIKEVEELMAVIPDWAEGLPLAAEGWRGKRYRK